MFHCPQTASPPNRNILRRTLLGEQTPSMSRQSTLPFDNGFCRGIGDLAFRISIVSLPLPTGCYFAG